MVRASFRRIMASPAVDAIVRIIVVLSVAASGYAVWQDQESDRRDREFAKCVAAYNNANNTRSVAISNAQDEERAAERKADDAQAALFLSPVLNQSPGERTPAQREELLRLFRAYQLALADQSKERAAADGARRDHPIPDPPDEVCD